MGRGRRKARIRGHYRCQQVKHEKLDVFMFSSGEWVEIKPKPITLLSIFIHVVFQFRLVAFATQR